MACIGWKLPEIAEYGWKWLEMAEMTENDWKWLKMAGKGLNG